MAWLRIIWDDVNTAKVRDHGLEPEDVDHVIDNPFDEAVSQTSGRNCYFGFTPDGRYIIVPYDELDEDSIYPVTAFVVPESTR